MKSKPYRYGIKIWVNCKSPSEYVWDSQVYTGQISFAPEKKRGQRVVLDLVKGLGQGYGVTCDNFFTSLELAKELAKQNKTLLCTIKQIRKEVPKIMLSSKSREVNSSLLLFSRDAMMVSYVPRKTNLLFCCLASITIRQLALHNMLSQILYWITKNLRVKCSRHSSYVECNDISTRSIRSFDNLLFKFNVSLPLVTGELLQNTVAVNNVTYKLYNIKI